MTERMSIKAYWAYQQFTLTTGVLAEKGKIAVVNTATGLVTKGGLATTYLPLGVFAETLTGDGVKKVQVELWEEIVGRWWVNDTVAPITAAMLGKAAYIKDDQTVSATSTGASVLGAVLAVDAVKGVLVRSGFTGFPATPAAEEEV